MHICMLIMCKSAGTLPPPTKTCNVPVYLSIDRFIYLSIYESIYASLSIYIYIHVDMCVYISGKPSI